MPRLLLADIEKVSVEASRYLPEDVLAVGPDTADDVVVADGRRTLEVRIRMRGIRARRRTKREIKRRRVLLPLDLGDLLASGCIVWCGIEDALGVGMCRPREGYSGG